MITALRARGVRRATPRSLPDAGTGRGTLLVAVALLLMAFAVAGPDVTGSILGVLLAVGLSLASLLPSGLADAARTWRLRHWGALAWGTVVVWSTLLVAQVTAVMQNQWYALGAVLLAGLPLVLLNSLELRKARTAS